MPHQLTRRHLLAGAAVTAACSSMPAAAIEVAAERPSFPLPPYIDRQTFFDCKVDWTFYARRGEWVGCNREGTDRMAGAA